MKKLLILFLILTSTSFNGISQQLPHYTQYMLNYYGLNPAAITYKNCVDVRLGYRTQWLSLPGRPVTQFLSVNSFIKTRKHKKPKHGIGAYIEGDEIGLNNKIGLYLSYSYHMHLARDWTAAVGFFAGAVQYGFDAGASIYLDQTDNAIRDAASTWIYPDICPGIWLYSKKAFGGLSVKNSFGNSLDKVYGSNSRFTRHYYTTYGFKFLSYNNEYTFTPSFLLKFSPFGPPSLDLNILCDYRNKFTLGATYRTIDAVAAMVRFNVSQTVFVGYSFDYTLSKLRLVSSNSHEIMLGIKICKSKVPSDPQICPAYQ